MNFNEQNVHKVRKKMATSSSKIEKKAGVTFARIFFAIFLALAITVLFLVIGITKGILDDAPDVSEINIVPSGYATFIYDANGKQLQKLTAPSSNRMSVSLDKIPVDLQHAVVAIEDERFYEHNGIDPRGIVRAFVVGITNGFHFSEGASTITQQLLKNNVFTDWTSESTWIDRIKRKIQEQYLAVQLEAQIKDKNIILENYLNTINLGAGTYGVQAASQRYFGKNSEDLTLSECTVLAGITQNPSRFNPITHPEYNAERRAKVLSNMVEQGYITEEQQAEALADDVYTRIAQAQELQSSVSTVYSYFIDELTEQVVSDLQEKKGYTESQAYQALYSGGLRVYTTQDEDIQQICDEEYQNPDNFPAQIQYELDWALTVTKADGSEVNYSQEMMIAYFSQTEGADFDLLFDSEEDAQSHVDGYKASVMEEGDEVLAERCNFIPEPQSSIVIIDQRTGYVKAIVGGRGEKTASLTLNRASNTLRQPGSTFKVLSTYAPALEEKNMTLATVFEDEPTTYSNGQPVNNWLTNSYAGPTTIRDAIVNSVNTVAVQCITEVTPQLGIEYLKKFGFSTISDANDKYQPLALGGIYNGVSNLELTGAYATIANQGEYIRPVFYTQILDQDGNVILDNTTPETTRVLKESTAFLLTSAMMTVVTEGTGRSLQLDDMTVAGKTGTTSDYNDVWFAGFSPYYTCTVWAGYDNYSKLPDGGVYHTYQQTLWRKVMERIHEGLSDPGFEPPASVTEVSICTTTGELSNWSCPKRTEFFALGTAPTEHCTRHGWRSILGGGSSSNTTTPTPTPTTTPEADAPDTDASGTDTPGTDTPSTDTPSTDTPGTDTPDADPSNDGDAIPVFPE